MPSKVVILYEHREDITTFKLLLEHKEDLKRLGLLNNLALELPDIRRAYQTTRE